MGVVRLLMIFLLISIIIGALGIFGITLVDVRGQAIETIDGVYVRIIPHEFDGVLEGYLIDGNKLLVKGGYVIPLELFRGFNYTIEVLGYGYLKSQKFYNGYGDVVAFNLTPAPLIHGYVVGPDGKGIPHALIFMDEERMIYAVSDTNGYYAIYSPYPINSTINMSIRVTNQVLDLNEYLEPGAYKYIMEESGWQKNFNESMYQMYPIYPYVKRGAINKKITNFNVSSQNNFMNITLNYSYIYKYSLDFGGINLQNSVLRLKKVNENGSITRVAHGYFDWEKYWEEYYVFISSNLDEANISYIHSLVYIKDIKQVRSVLDEVHLKAINIERTEFDYLNYLVECEEDTGWCTLVSYRSQYGMVPVTGRIVFNGGLIPDNTYIYIRGDYYNVDVAGNVTAIYKVNPDGSFKVYLPYAYFDEELTYYVVVDVEETFTGRYLRILKSGTFTLKGKTTSLDLGTINVNADVFVIRGTLSDYQNIPEPVTIVARGYTNDPSLTLRFPGRIYENGTFIIYVIQNLFVGNQRRQYTYEVDAVSNFYCQAVNPDISGLIINSNVTVGNISCLTSPLKPLKIEVYPSAPPTPGRQQYFKFIVGVNTTDYNYPSIIYDKTDVMEIRTLPDSNGNYYPVQFRFGVLYREYNSSIGDLVFMMKSIPGQEVNLEIKVASTVFSSDFTVSLAYSGVVKPLLIGGVSYNQSEGTMTFTVKSDGKGISSFAYLIIHSTEVIPEFQPIYTLLAVGTIAIFISLVGRFRRRHLSSV